MTVLILAGNFSFGITFCFNNQGVKTGLNTVNKSDFTFADVVKIFLEILRRFRKIQL